MSREFLSRRTVLRGVGTALALPWLDAWVRWLRGLALEFRL